jgi:hypothetical protein
MNNDTWGEVAAHNLLLKRDPSSIEHLIYKHRMASILASPQAAKKKRFIKLELGSVEASLPAGANPFQYSKIAGGTTQHNSEPNRRYVGNAGIKSSPTFTTSPTFMLDGGITQHNSEPD